MVKMVCGACLTLGLSALLCGCADVQTPDGQSRQPVVESPETTWAEPVQQEPATPEPNSPEQDDPVYDLPEAPPAEPISSQQDAPVEPNETAVSQDAGVAPAPPDEEIIAEPNQPEPEPVPASEPNSIPAAVTQPAEPPAEEDEPDPLASFYQEYRDLLQQYVREDGRVDYDSLRRKRPWLKQLLQAPDELDPSVYRNWTPDEQLAFWINTYNLKMLDIIARNYPIQSSWWLRLTWPPSDIRHIEGIWSEYRFIVMDEEFTLGEVERRLFRKTLADPRAYLAITYASRSGPLLRREPYRGENLDRQLDEQVRAFLSAGKGFRIDRDKAVVYLSSIFKPTWHGKEFVGRYGMDKKFKDRPPETRAVLNFLTRHVSDDEAYFLEVENYTIEYINFDWRLNDASRGY
ncbi:MAG: DUF547 domain-containing protein [Phycisphaerae bacterium]|nr:DUF547 domain-containing protein [Phycisphaerae bacterium]